MTKAMRDEGTLAAVACCRGRDWSAFTRLYEQAFPVWEREPLSRIASRVCSGRYRLTVLRCADEPVAGFHLLDQVAVLNYAVLTFLAVREPLRGRGLGQRLLRDAVCGFRSRPAPAWLFVEAKAGAARFYQSLGFRRLALDYEIPHYGSAVAMQPMTLLALHRDGSPGGVDGELIRRVIGHLFTDGYEVPPTDPRLTLQLRRVPDAVGVL